MTSPITFALQRDKTHYISTGDVVFLVENVLFRVHRHFFERESVFFKTLFETPPQKNQPAPGHSDSTAFILDDVTPSQFSRFVWVFYNPRYSIYDEATLDDWKSILELSQRWFFSEVKQLAIRELQKHKLTPVERIQLYHTNHVDRNLLLPDYLALCERPEPLNLKEGLDLGLETTLTIARAREEVRSPRSPEGVAMPWTPTVQGPELLGLVGKFFVASETNRPAANDSIVIGQPVPKPTIAINGIPQPNTPNGGRNGDSSQTLGGSPKQTEQRTSPQEAAKQKKKTENQNQKKEKHQGSQRGPKPTQTGEAVNSNEKKGKESKEGSGGQAPVAGQQGAGGTGGEVESGQKDDKAGDSSKGGAEVKNGVKPEEEGGPKAEGGDAQGAETTNSNGGASTSNGDQKPANGEENKNKSTGVEQQTTATPNPVGITEPNHDNSQQRSPVIDLSRNISGGGTREGPLVNPSGKKGGLAKQSTAQSRVDPVAKATNSFFAALEELGF